MKLAVLSAVMKGIAYDTTLSRQRLGDSSKVAPDASGGCFLTTRNLQYSGLAYKKFVVKEPNGSNVKLREMIGFLANPLPLQHRHLAQEEVIDGSDGPPAGPDFQDAKWFVVRPWFREGNILEYHAARPRPPTERLRLVAEVASALSYLHLQGIVHGNVCPTNILIAEDGRAILTDVKVYTAVVDFIFVPCGRVPVPPTARYKSAEELRSPDGLDVPPRTTDKDVYSLASSTYEIMSGKTPFGGMRLYTCVVKIARDGHLCLTQPEGITDGLWQLLQACWAINPMHRPKIEDVQGHLEALLTEDL